MTAPDEKRLQLLTDTAYEVGSDRGFLLDALRARLDVVPGGTAYAGVLRLLQAAAWRDQEAVAGFVDDLFKRQRELDAHACTTGHDVCCEGTCPCTRLFRGRCDLCDATPKMRADDAERDLVRLLEELVSPRAIADTLGGAA